MSDGMEWASQGERGIMRSKYLFLILFAFVFGGCSALDLGDLHADGVKAYGACIKGGPGGVAGLGPSGVVARAKVDRDFKGKVKVGSDCSVIIESE